MGAALGAAAGPEDLPRLRKLLEAEGLDLNARLNASWALTQAAERLPAGEQTPVLRAPAQGLRGLGQAEPSFSPECVAPLAACGEAGPVGLRLSHLLGGLDLPLLSVGIDDQGDLGTGSHPPQGESTTPNHALRRGELPGSGSVALRGGWSLRDAMLEALGT